MAQDCGTCVENVDLGKQVEKTDLFRNVQAPDFHGKESLSLELEARADIRMDRAYLTCGFGGERQGCLDPSFSL